MKKINIIYWISTGLLAALMLVSGISNVMVVPDAIEMISKHLGYPVSLIPLLGVAKTLGAIAILVPGFNRIREWAYAGFVFDLAGAAYSGYSVGDPPGMWMPVLIFIGVLAISYVFYHRRKALRAKGTDKVFDKPVQFSGAAI